MSLWQKVASTASHLMLFASVAATASAQSAIAGNVKDATGGILPGVNVEVTSPALIERVRVAITDDQGLYQITNLPPGTYKISFSLPGFASVNRQDLQLPGEFTATVNVELRVGGIEESLTVSGASPVVDMQSTAKAQVVNRELLDVLPTGKTVQTMAALVPGVINSAQDVGGSGSMNQNYPMAHGMSARETVVMLDGIMLKGMEGNGTTQSYSNVQNYEEVVYQTSGAGADVSGGGVRQLIVPRRGGNDFHGSFSGVWSAGSWQSDNVTPELIARGLRGGNKIDHIYTFEGGQGGRIIRDKLWFFATARRQSVDEFVAGSFYDDGTQALNDQYVENYGARLTFQLTRRDQITAYADRVFKFLGHGDGGSGYDPETATRVWHRSPLYQQSSAKWTSTLSNRLMLDVGFNQYQAQRNSDYQPGVAKPFLTPAWYAGANRNDTSTGTNTTAAPGGHLIVEPIRNAFATSLAYVTGSHNIKAGIQKAWGYQNFGTVEFNAALRQIYQNSVPTSVVVSNAPVRYNNVLAGDWGIYGQDSWTLRRFTLSYGLRWERFSSYVGQRGDKAEESGTSRFIPTMRSFGPERMPVYTAFTPRFGVVYDLFGDARTALKFSANKYNAQLAAGLAEVLNPVRPLTATLAWNDLNRDDIAQGELGCTYLSPGCEINLAQLPVNFGLTPAGCSTLYAAGNVPCGNTQVDPDIKRDYSVNYSVGVQHALLPQVSVSANWYHVGFHNIQTDVYSMTSAFNPVTTNILRTRSDYTPAQIVSPLDGSIVTVYNVAREKVSQVRDVIINDPDRRRWNNAFDASVSSRLAGQVTLFGGYATERSLEVACGDLYSSSDPNRLLYCDMRDNNIPWLHQFKAAGSFQAPWAIQISAAFQSLIRPLSSTGTNSAVWQITPTTRYPANCVGPCTPGALVNPGQTIPTMNVPLEAPFIRLQDRTNQLDLNFGKWLNAGGIRFMPTLAIFNTLNASPVLSVRSTNYLTSSYMQPATILQPRMFRLGLDMKW
jgi:Carboxypeptidase regulatory-like domain/TonB-dependent Receptor Plug Domain